MPSHSRPRALFPPYCFEPGQGLWRDGREVPLPPRALGVLEALTTRPGSVISKSDLMDAVWREAFVTEASLLEAIRVLREALGDDRQNPTFIQTVHRRGYRFIAPITLVAPDTPARPDHHTAPIAPPPPDTPVAPDLMPLLTASVAAAAAMVGIAIVFALFGQRPLESRPTMHLSIGIPEPTVMDPMRGTVAVAPDGTKIVFVGLVNGQSRLFLRALDRETPTPIDGSEGAAEPFLSPDGQWVAFFADGSLKKVPIAGGTPITVSPVRRAGGGAWIADNSIVFGGAAGGGLSRVSADGGRPTTIVAPPAGSRDVAYGWPDVLPGDAGILYTATSVTGSRLALVDPANGQTWPLLDRAAYGRYSPTGHVIYERRGRLEAVPFSPRDRRIAPAAARPVLVGVAGGATPDAGPRFAFADNGSLVYVPGDAALHDRLHWLDIDGRLEPMAGAAVASSADLTPDLQYVAIGVDGDAGSDLWVGDLRRGAVSRLSTDGQSTSPAWRPDGLEIAFAYSKAGPFNVFLRPADRDLAARPLVEGPWNQVPTSWSADGRWLTITEYHPLTGADIWLVDVATGDRRVVARTPYDESHARFSPDGRWLAYMSNESGRWEVVVRARAAGGPRVQVSAGGGAWPAWSIDGRLLYFSHGQGISAASIETGDTLRVGRVRLIPGRHNLQVMSGRAAADRVLVRPLGPSSRGHELGVIVEWFAELTRLARTPA
jgi:serine/threonine-protein kinase